MKVKEEAVSVEVQGTVESDRPFLAVLAAPLSLAPGSAGSLFSRNRDIMTCLHTAGTCLMCMMILDLLEVHDHHGPLKMPCRTTTKQLTLHPRDVDHDGTAHHLCNTTTCTARSLARSPPTDTRTPHWNACMHAHMSHLAVLHAPAHAWIQSSAPR